VYRLIYLMPALVTLSLLAGCGESKTANPPAPANSGRNEPSADGALTDNQPGASSLEQSPAEEPPPEAAQAEPTSQEEGPPSESEAAEPEAMPEEREAEEETETSATAPAGEQEQDRQGAADDTGRASTKRRGSSGKLLRGLSSSLSRALSKAAGGERSRAAERTEPDLADDPFPDGEPVENNNKSKEQAE
jgi:hypothetical protein